MSMHYHAILRYSRNLRLCRTLVYHPSGFLHMHHLAIILVIVWSTVIHCHVIFRHSRKMPVSYDHTNYQGSFVHHITTVTI
jgi:hypothetical protein